MEHVAPIAAIFNLNDIDFEAWMAVRWELLKLFMTGAYDLIHPCMLGPFSYDGRRYCLSMDGLRAMT